MLAVRGKGLYLTPGDQCWREKNLNALRRQWYFISVKGFVLGVTDENIEPRVESGFRPFSGVRHFLQDIHSCTVATTQQEGLGEEVREVLGCVSRP